MMDHISSCIHIEQHYEHVDLPDSLVWVAGGVGLFQSRRHPSIRPKEFEQALNANSTPPPRHCLIIGLFEFFPIVKCGEGINVLIIGNIPFYGAGTFFILLSL